MLIHDEEFTGLVAELGNFLVCNNTIEIKAEYTVDIMATRHAIIAVCYMFVILFRLLVQGDISFVPRAFYGKAVLFAIGFIEFC